MAAAAVAKGGGGKRRTSLLFGPERDGHFTQAGPSIVTDNRPVVAIADGSALVCYRSGQDSGSLRIVSWRRGRSADLRASRTAAWDSSLSANASKVLSTRVLLPIAPRRHSAASTLSNSGEYILSTGPLLRLG